MDIITKHGDIGHAFQNNGFDISIVEGQPRATARNISPIHTYHKRNQISNEQFSAGAELYRCYYNAIIKGFGNNCTMNFAERLKSGPPVNAADIQADCYSKLKRGLAATGDNDYHTLRIVCHEISVAQIAKNRKERDEIKSKLKISLTEIAKEFGIIPFDRNYR